MRASALPVVTTVAALLLTSGARAHDWSEMAPDEQSPARLGLALDAAEALQSEALGAETVPALAHDASGAAWLGWLTGAAALDTRAARAALADRLVASGFVAAADRDAALDEWQHALEHLTLVWDAVEQRVGPGDMTQAAARLERPDLGDAEAARLSYRMWLATVSDEERQALSPLLGRLTGVIERARGAGGGR